MKTAQPAPTDWELDFAAPQDAAAPLLLAISDAALQRLLATIFSAAGYHVTAATEGREACELLERQVFPILITELELPCGGGVQLARELMKHDALAECVLLACPENVEHLFAATDTGLIYNHFWKPLHDAGDLIRSVGRAIERREMRIQQARLLTELRDTRNENRAYCCRLEQLDKVVSLGQMTEAVAQSLHAPLANLRAYAQYLHARIQRDETVPLTEEQMARIQDYLCDMEKGVIQCESVVSQVIEYTRIHEEPPVPTCPVTALDTALALLRDEIAAQGLTLNYNVAEILPPVLANPHRLQQVVINLVRNAQQALGASGGVISIVAKQTPDSQELAIQVEDDGPGIAQSVLPHIFLPFFSTHSNRENLGLGLTIARSIARESKGELHVCNGVNRGVIATLTLPLCDEIALPNLHLSDLGYPPSRMAA